MDWFNQVGAAVSNWLRSVQAAFDERVFREGFMAALMVLFVLWLVSLVGKALAGNLRKARSRLDQGPMAERLGRADQRLDAHVTEKLAGDAQWTEEWERTTAALATAESATSEARRAKGKLLVALAKTDKEVAQLLAEREHRASPAKKRYAVPNQQSHHEALLKGAAAWSEYRAQLSVPPTLTGLDLCGADLSGYDLSGADLYRVSLVGARLDGADLTGADMISATCVGASLTGARLDGAVLARADLSHADLRSASMVGAELSRACLIGARLDQAQLEYARFLHTSLPDGRLVTGEGSALSDTIRASQDQAVR